MDQETLEALKFIDEQTAQLQLDRITHTNLVLAIKHIQNKLNEGAKAEAILKTDLQRKTNDATKPSVQ